VAALIDSKRNTFFGLAEGRRERVLLRSALALTCIAGSTSAALPQRAEPVRIERDGLKFELAALSQDQVRAFFLARGFAAQQVEQIVETACLHRSAIGSAFTIAEAPEVRVALTEWQVAAAGKEPHSPKVREDWETVWKRPDIPEDAATAFYWALFPTDQTFKPTDYNWGFLTFGLPPGTVFDLRIVWRTDGTAHRTTIEGLQCAQ